MKSLVDFSSPNLGKKLLKFKVINQIVVLRNEPLIHCLSNENAGNDDVDSQQKLNLCSHVE